MKDGLLDDKGKANDKTPTDWYKRYKEYSHTGEELSLSAKKKDKSSAGGDSAEVASSPNGAGDAEEAAEVDEVKEEVEEGESEKKKKKKKKKHTKEEKDDED